MDPTPVKPEVRMTEPGQEDGRHLASQDIMGALHSQSPGKVMEALSNFIDLHMHSNNGNASGEKK